jgi:hypothetical protein
MAKASGPERVFSTLLAMACAGIQHLAFQIAASNFHLVETQGHRFKDSDRACGP